VPGIPSLTLGGRPVGLSAIPSVPIWALVLLAGIAVYLAGLFAPVGGEDR
jgi:hypothetical protein